MSFQREINSWWSGAYFRRTYCIKRGFLALFVYLLFMISILFAIIKMRKRLRRIV